MTNQWRRAAAVVAVAAMTLAACGQQTTPPASSGTPAASATVASKRGAGDDLKILYWQAATILNPHLATGTKDFDASRLVLEPLASWGPDGKPLANGLAAEIPTVANGGVSADLTTVTWKLRQGVKWSDGTDFTSDDVVFTYEYNKDPKTASTTSDNLEGVKSITAKDKYTVVVTYEAPQPNYFQWGVGGTSAILQKAQFGAYIGEKAKDAPGNQKPIGTGAYVVDTFKSGDVVTYKMNDKFRDPNKPYFKTVTWKGGGDATSAARAVFQTGDVDYGWNLQVEAGILKPMADSSTKGKLLTVYGSSVERILLNFADPSASLGDKRGEPDTKHPFFNGPDGKTVRTALAMATDRKTVAQQIYGDGLSGKPGCNIVTGVAEYESKNTTDFCNKFDVAGAAKMLDDAGWKLGSDGVRAKGGIKLNILYQTTVNPVRQKTQDIMKKNWEAAGFKVELKSVPADVFFTNTSPDGANHFWADVEMFTNNSESTDFTSYLNGWISKQATGKANQWNSANYNRYQNPQFDTIVDQLRKETDPAKRAQLFIQANDILILDVVIIPVVSRTQVTSGMSNTLKNVVPTGWDSEMYAIADWTK